MSDITTLRHEVMRNWSLTIRTVAGQRVRPVRYMCRAGLFRSEITQMLTPPVDNKEHERDNNEANQGEKHRQWRFREHRIAGSSVAVAIAVVPLSIAPRIGRDWISATKRLTASTAMVMKRRTRCIGYLRCCTEIVLATRNDLFCPKIITQLSCKTRGIPVWWSFRGVDTNRELRGGFMSVANGIVASGHAECPRASP